MNTKCSGKGVSCEDMVSPNTKTICDTCYEIVSFSSLSQLWEELGDIPVNNDDEIETDFLHFPAGTYKFDIWHWFDERCPNNLHDDLMFPSNKKVNHENNQHQLILLR